MSDAEDSSGTFEDAGAVRETKTWEARLEEARKQRASALAEANGSARAKSAPEGAEITDLFPSQKKRPESTAVDRPHILTQPKEPKRQKRHLRGVAIVMAAMFFGAFLHWTANRIEIDWQAIAQQWGIAENPSSQAPPTNEGPTSATDPVILSSDRTSQEFQGDEKEGVLSFASEPGVSSEVSDWNTEEVLDGELPNMYVSSPLSEGSGDTSLNDAVQTKPLSQNTAQSESTEQAAQTLPEGPFDPPLLYVPSEWAKVPQLHSGTASPVSSPAPENTFAKITGTPALFTSFPDASEINDQVLQNLLVSTSPSNFEVKPLPISPRNATLDVSLFVPARVSGDASDKALQALATGRANIVATARVPYSVRETQVRFYHPTDAEIAELAAAALGGVSRDFTNSNSKTRPGHVEVYLAGSGGGQQRNSGSRPRSFDEFIARLLDELRQN